MPPASEHPVRAWFQSIAKRAGKMPVRIRAEQAVYGSFAEHGGGYGIVSHSPGCRPDWLAALRRVCERFGERPRHVTATGALIACNVSTSAWMVVRVQELGTDDRGRPGALGFHAFFLHPRDYRNLGGAPFPLVELFGAARRSEIPLQAAVTPFGNEEFATTPESERIAGEIARGHRCVLESAEPIRSLAETIWRQLPLRVRLRRSLATWVFANEADYDLAAVPEKATTKAPGVSSNSLIRDSVEE